MRLHLYGTPPPPLLEKQTQTRNMTMSPRSRAQPNTVTGIVEGESQIHISTKTSFHLERSRQHPFVDKIMNVKWYVGWKELNMDRYDRTTDPDEYCKHPISSGQIKLF